MLAVPPAGGQGTGASWGTEGKQVAASAAVVAAGSPERLALVVASGPVERSSSRA